MYCTLAAGIEPKLFFSNVFEVLSVALAIVFPCCPSQQGGRFAAWVKADPGEFLVRASAAFLVPIVWHADAFCPNGVVKDC